VWAIRPVYAQHQTFPGRVGTSHLGQERKELAALLQETTLSAIITAAKTVVDRLKFIAALESIVFDPETKGRLKERSQLHKILAENTWIFGEE
jgi:hypothetical protein